MATLVDGQRKFHESAGVASVLYQVRSEIGGLQYEFQDFFHPFVGKLIAQLNASSVAGMLAPKFLGSCTESYSTDYTSNPNKTANITTTLPNPTAIDVGIGGPYANY
jgi:hypothetical protein